MDRTADILHRLRNHLGVVVTFGSLILDDLAPDDEHRTDVAAMRESALDGLALVRELEQAPE